MKRGSQRQVHDTRDLWMVHAVQNSKEADLNLNREPPQIMHHTDHSHPP
jgi:hypothetical protein